MTTVYGDLVRYRELFGNLFRRDVQAKYRGSLLGVAWTLANPVLLMAVYLLVFSVLWKTPFGSEGHYALFLLVGLAAWIFFATSVQSASRSLLDNANLIRKTRFPRQLVPLSVVATHLISFAVMLVALLAVNFALLPRVRATEWLAIPLGLAVVAISAGLALAIASLNVLFRDIEFLISALLLPLFFLTPVLYPLSSPQIAQRDWVVALIHWGNPLSPMIEALRDPLFYGRLPSLGDTIYTVIAAIVALALGAFVFNRVDDQIAVEV
ncbi:MAG: lipopolysaccharide transport system permease protein [Gaiellaceae bacterium]|jgi:ABC-type polysaccharide/polyol phosphate export permease|nr:lipopolysaccharide transport system permease protein [Gaiellaceae bacterium]